MGRLSNISTRLKPKGGRVKFRPKRADRFYLSPEWIDYRKRHRAWTIQRQGGVWCVKCGSTNRLVLDHRKERKDGGADLPPFEEAEWHCHPCHQAKTARQRRDRADGKLMKADIS